ncbi:MAG: hypothetical protein JWP37_974 [Mucilaginibacter sp.]|nr:hypothetical protein [Mucilaginibacter sp.]
MRKSGRAIVISLFVLVAICFFSCKKIISDRQELMIYINDPGNGLKKTEQIEKIKTVLLYKPWQLIAVKQQTINGKSKNSDPFKIKDKLFFVLSLSANNKELLRQLPFGQYSEMVQVLAFRMNEFIDIVPDDKKAVEPQECIFQQTYGMGIANNLLIVFNKGQLMSADNLRVRVKEFGLNTGNLNFEIKTKDIKELRDIVLKN